MADMDVLQLAVTSSLEADAHRYLAKIPFQHNCMRVSTKTGGTSHSHGHLRRMRQIHQTIFCFRGDNEQRQRCSTREGSVRKSADFYSYTGTVNCTTFTRFKSYKGVSRTLDFYSNMMPDLLRAMTRCRFARSWFNLTKSSSEVSSQYSVSPHSSRNVFLSSRLLRVRYWSTARHALSRAPATQLLIKIE